MGDPTQPTSEPPKPIDARKAEADSKRFEESLKQMVSHSDRMWKAEEQNAARIANRSNLALTAISAVIGLKLLAFGKEVTTLYVYRGSWAWWTFMIAFGLSVLYLLRALRLVLGSSWTKKDTSASSANLIIDKAIAEAFFIGPKGRQPARSDLRRYHHGGRGSRQPKHKPERIGFVGIVVFLDRSLAHHCVDSIV
jgi:hypothetical protein